MEGVTKKEYSVYDFDNVDNSDRLPKGSVVALQAGLTYLAVMNYRKGVTEEFASQSYDPNVMSGSQPIPSPYSAYPSTGESGDPYQQSPFGGPPSSGFQQGGGGGFQQGGTGGVPQSTY